MIYADFWYTVQVVPGQAQGGNCRAYRAENRTCLQDVGNSPVPCRNNLLTPQSPQSSDFSFHFSSPLLSSHLVSTHHISVHLNSSQHFSALRSSYQISSHLSSSQLLSTFLFSSRFISCFLISLSRSLSPLFSHLLSSSQLFSQFLSLSQLLSAPLTSSQFISSHLVQLFSGPKPAQLLDLSAKTNKRTF